MAVTAKSAVALNETRLFRDSFLSGVLMFFLLAMRKV